MRLYRPTTAPVSILHTAGEGGGAGPPSWLALRMVFPAWFFFFEGGRCPYLPDPKESPTYVTWGWESFSYLNFGRDVLGPLPTWPREGRGQRIPQLCDLGRGCPQLCDLGKGCGGTGDPLPTWTGELGDTLLLNRMTDACVNIIFPRILLRTWSVKRKLPSSNNKTF